MNPGPDYKTNLKMNPGPDYKMNLKMNPGPGLSTNLRKDSKDESCAEIPHTSAAP